jgi:hypothetical protein
MHFAEFKDWFDSSDAALQGQPPSLKLWWELKARLEAVVPDVAKEPSQASSPPAVPAQPSPSPKAEPQIEDIGSADAEPIDPEPGDFRALSIEKDGGLSAEVVDALRKQQAQRRRA